MMVVGGESLVDLLVTPDGRLTAATGGSPYNTARTIARLGAHVAFLGRISDDRFGRQLRRTLETDGVDCSPVVETSDPTLLALAELDADGHAHYRFYTEGTAAPGLTVADLDARLPAAPAALHVGSLGLVLEPMASSLLAAVERMPDSTLISVDPNCRPSVIEDLGAYRALMWRLLGRVDLVKASTDDLEVLAPGCSPEATAREMLESGPRVVLVTDGARSVRVHRQAGGFDIAVPTVEVVDTVGAGDAFAGGFLARWMERGLGRQELDDEVALRDAVGFAVVVAALTCTRPGAQPPTRSEVQLARPGLAPPASGPGRRSAPITPGPA